MEELYKKLVQFYRYLAEKGVIQDTSCPAGDYYALVDQIYRELIAAYPETKLKKPMRAVHYANGFDDLKLKQTAYTLDDIEQILRLNHLHDHDRSVDYFNEQIVEKEITPFTLTETMIESLMYS